jgi:ATP-binding cassette subfamily F protein 2
VSFHGAVILDGCELQLNSGNRYGLIGRNGSGKSTLMRVVGSRAVPIPDTIDIYHLTTEYVESEKRGCCRDRTLQRSLRVSEATVCTSI